MPHDDPAVPANWVPLASLLRPQGRRGELLSDPLTDLPGVFEGPRSVWLSPPGASLPSSPTQPLTLESSWRPTGKNAGRIVLKLSGCDSISAAEALSGQQILTDGACLPALDPDTFFVGDLIGCALFDGDTLAGTVADVQFVTGPDGRTRLEDAAPLLSVLPPSTPSHPESLETDTVLVPFIRAWLQTVDLAAHRIVMHLPPGFFDPEPASDDPQASTARSSKREP